MKILFTKQAQKDLQKVKQDETLKKRVKILLQIFENNPLQNPPQFEKLTGDLKGAYSRRINNKHWLVYRIVDNEVWVLAMWSHYESV